MVEERDCQASSCPTLDDGPVKLSVAMITYNHERFIAQAIESALMQQTDFRYEIVIGEDCSTDRTRDIVIDYANRHPERIRLVLHERNVGSGRNSAETLGACRGEYVAWLEGDDYWISPDKLQKQVEFLDSHPECAMCFHRIRIVWDDERRGPYDWSPSRQEEILALEDLLSGCHIPPCSVMFRLALLPVQALSASDWEAQFLLAQRGDIGYTDEVMAVYRVHSGGVWSGLSRRQQLQETLHGYEELNAALDFQYDESIRNYLSTLYYQLASEYEKQGDLERAAACLRECVQASSTALEGHLLHALGLPGPAAQKMVRRRLWLYSHPTCYRLVRFSQPLTEGIEKLWMTLRGLGRSAVGRSIGSITADPNPIQVAGRDGWDCGVTTLAWSSAGTETVEVRLGAPDGRLFSRGGPSGSQATSEWVRNGMEFYLQDVSDGRPLTWANTLARVRVSVTTDEGVPEKT